MDKQELIKKIQNPAVVDYTYGIVFFLIFIFFVVVVIGPNIATVFKLRQQYVDLRAVNDQYTQTIMAINKLQSLILTRRDDFPLLTITLPEQVKISQVISDLDALRLDESNSQDVAYPGFVVGTQSKVVDKKTPANELKSFPLLLKISGSQSHISDVIDQLLSQKRIKTISQYVLTPSGVASTSATLDAQIEVLVYYQ
ncbi:MAG: hypothetical protein WCO78_00725 [Candidatus Roizmanbacteria bacterium]